MQIPHGAERQHQLRVLRDVLSELEQVGAGRQQGAGAGVQGMPTTLQQLVHVRCHPQLPKLGEEVAQVRDAVPRPAELVDDAGLLHIAR